MTGEKKIYSLDELRLLGKDHVVRLTGLFDGPRGIAIELGEDTILMVPGVGMEARIADQYGIF